MSRASALATRLLLLNRSEAGEAKYRSRHGVPDGEQAITAAQPAGEQPYPGTIPVDQVTAYRLAAASEYLAPKPEFQAVPHAAPATAPMPVLTEDELRAHAYGRVARGLRRLDVTALDAAKNQESLTYADTDGAELHNELLAAPRKPDGTPGLALAAARRLTSLAYPACDGSATFRDYAALFRRVNELTGTQGTGWWPLPALPAGESR